MNRHILKRVQGILGRTKEMRRTFIILLLISWSVTACQDALEERYARPGDSEPSIDKLLTRLLDDNRVRPSYWEMSTMVNWHIGVYSQTVGFLNSDFIYQQNEQYIQERWNDFYRPSANGAGVMAQYREMERLYGSMDPAEQEEWQVFMCAARIKLMDQATRLVDLWGDIPFSEAGMLNATGMIVYPKFDDGEAVYRSAINQLAADAQNLGTIKLSTVSASLFAEQDILLKGNVSMWQRYANALRLRLLMRISATNADTIRTTVLGMLSDPLRFPLPGGDGEYVPGKDDVLLSPLATYADDLHAAFTDWTNYPAPYYLLEHVLKPVDDPRIPVMFDKYGAYSGLVFSPNESYRGLPVDAPAIEQEGELGGYAILDSATFLLNNQLPGVIMTTAEVDFLRAEAFARWGGGDAARAYSQGLKHSVQFYYYLNTLGNRPTQMAQPTNELLETFVSRDDVRLPASTDERLSRIWVQKWAHFGFLQAYDAWAELRRTNYPRLHFRPAASNGDLPPMRLTYPLSEKSFNPNYADVAPADLRSQKVFWDVD